MTQSLRQIRRKIRSIKSIQKITRSMYMVSASRFKKAQIKTLHARPFANRIEELLQDLLLRVPKEVIMKYPLFYSHDSQKIFLIFSSDRGLCGSFNMRLFQEVIPQLNKDTKIITVGKKAYLYFSKIGFVIINKYLNFFLKPPTYAQAEIIAKDLTELKGLNIYIAYNEFKSVLIQKPTIKQLLPLQLTEKSNEKNPVEYIYEPSKEELINSLAETILRTRIYHYLLESYCCEQAARMKTMDQATNNAEDLIFSLTLLANKVRQSSITKEIIEVVSGAA